ncbi:MAG: class II fructose-bisphosphate aldolase, partial [Kiritimatiellales bacterium]|nr:class II fructose-bisphosphate aldolase [Kiritimatiellales bacterium]
PYEELFESGKGFTDPDGAKRIVDETGGDWLSVAVGNIHGAISAATKDKKKIATRLNIEHLDRIYRKINIPIVLHGGTGIRKEYIMESIKHGIAKINVAAAIRLPYEQTVSKGVGAAQDAVYNAMLTVLRDDLEVQDSANLLNPEE